MLRALRRDHGRDAADPGRGAARDLSPVPADLPARPAACCRCRSVERDAEAGTIIYRDEDGTPVETPVTGGRCKLQWKVDWAMRWAALERRLRDVGQGSDRFGASSSAQICRILGGAPPEGFTYELFLDEKGEKISKSKGNGLTVEEWLRYAPPESLALFMFNSPRTAKRLYLRRDPARTSTTI